MEKPKFTQNILWRLMTKTGGWYIVIVTFLAQVAASITTLFAVVFEQLNADYSPETTALLRRIELIVIPAVIIALVAAVFILTRNLRARLNTWKRNPEFLSKDDGNEAWKLAHNIVWKYALTAVGIAFSFIVIPKALLLSQRGIASRDQAIYSVIAGLITILAFVPLSTVLLDRFMTPVRSLLLPKDYSKQLSGLSKLRILYKILAIVFISLLISVLLIAPIGYHQTTRVLYEEIGSIEVLTDLQVQSVLVGGFAILFAVSLAFILSRSISDPLQQLLESFQRVERGDLNTRMTVTSTDETSKLAIYFNRMVARLQGLQSGLEKMVEERTAQLKAINAVGRVATSILDPDELINRVVNLITEEFGYYYSAIYIVDQTNKWAELKEATGEAGRVLRESKHRLAIDQSNIIGRTIRSRQAQIALDIGEKALRFNYPLLPYTRSEISLPLYVGDRILGTLDVHSSQEAAFSEQDIETLQNMANQVAISLDNARLFQETNQNLQEMRNIQKQYLHEAWIDTNLPGGEISLVAGDDSDEGDGKKLVEVPIALRDQTIGRLRLEGNEIFSLEEQNWLEAIATQTALALENARLLDESQSTAMREKFVTEITNKIWSSTTIDGILQTAVRELGQILDATEATIELNIKGD
ncbi:MAG: GAF domain-containing protein [Anaerolineales bacterium]|nr:GAF domain-containing protein [Anaerolineales bacterium]